MKRWFTLLSLLITSGATATAQSAPAAIRIDGSQGMQACTKRLTEWYHNGHTDTSFRVISAGTDKGFAALIEGKADIAQSSRRALGGEITALRERRGKPFVHLPVATEVAGIFVHPANSVHALSLFELRQILSGTVKNWKQVGGPDAPITIYGRDDSSDIREFLEEEFMGDEGISSSTNKFAKNSDLYSAVARDRNGIGFASVDLALAQKVRFLGIKASSSGPAFEPSAENIRGHKYPLQRPLYLVFVDEPKGDMQRFSEWVLSAQGQLVVEAAEFWPLSASDRDAGKQLLAAR